MKLHFTKTNSLFGKLIRWRTLGEVNHVWIEFEGHAYEANGSIAGFVWQHFNLDIPDEGVVKKAKGRGEVVKTIEVEVSDYPRLRGFLEDQVGKRYDYNAIFGIGLLNKEYLVKEPRWGYWYCSELADVALQIAKGNPNPIALMSNPQRLMESL